MFNTNTAKFVANVKENIVEITQLTKQETLDAKETVKVDALELLHLLQTDFSKENITNKSIYSKSGTKITYGSNMHLREERHLINTYLTRGYDSELINYIRQEFTELKKNNEILQNKKNNKQTVRFIQYHKRKAKFLREYHLPMLDFMGLIGVNDEELEITLRNDNREIFHPDKETSRAVVKNFRLCTDK